MSTPRKKHSGHGVLWWLFIGWWWWPCRLICYDLPKLIVKSTRSGGQTQNRSPVNPSAPAPVYAPQKPEPTPAPAKPAPEEPALEKTYKVTGMNYRMESLLALAVENDDYHLSKRAMIEDGLTEERVYEYGFYPTRTELIPEPDNPYDPNAIKVVVNGQHVGYIKAGFCSHLLRVIREGRIERIRCIIGGGRYKYLAVEDYTEDGDEIYTLDNDETPYFVHLKIIER